MQRPGKNGKDEPIPKQPTKAEESSFEKIHGIHGITLAEVIGKGGYGTVKMGYSEKIDKKVAVKIIAKNHASDNYVKKFLPREMEINKGLNHDNIIAFYLSIETTHRVYLVMELAANGTLKDYVREKGFLEENEARKFFQQLMSAIEYIHSKNVVHRDIKCENILLDSEYKLKLADFGFARNDTRDDDEQVILSKTFCGSYAYASPEILKGVEYDPFLSDVWASGVVLHAMVFGRLPFDGSNLNRRLRHFNTPLLYPKSPPVSAECKFLIMHILTRIELRYTIAEIKADSWMTKENKK